MVARTTAEKLAIELRDVPRSVPGYLKKAVPIIEAAFAAERERVAKIADDYSEWTHWGQTDNAVAAEAAAEEIAAAIRKGRGLTTDEIREVDAARAARLKAQREGK